MPLPDWPDIYRCVRSLDYTSIQRYLRRGVNFRMTLTGTMNMLDLAAYYDYSRLVKLILEHQQFLTASTTEQTYLLRSALRTGFSQDSVKSIRLILETADTLSLRIESNYFGGNVTIVRMLMEEYKCNDNSVFATDGRTVNGMCAARYALENGYRDLLLYYKEKTVMLDDDIMILDDKITGLTLACGLGDCEAVKMNMKLTPEWTWKNFTKAFKITALCGDFKLLDYLLADVRKFENPDKINELVFKVAKKSIAKNRHDILNWCLDREIRDRTKYIKWQEVEDFVHDRQKKSVCLMLKTIMAKKYQNRYDFKNSAPDLEALFGNACIENDVATARFLVTEYGSYFKWNNAGASDCGHNNFDIVEFLIENGLSFHSDFGKRFSRALFLGFVDIVNGKSPSWFTALPCLELVLKRMHRVRYTTMNPWTAFLSKKAWRKLHHFVPELPWNCLYIHFHGIVSLLGEYFPVPEQIPYRVTEKTFALIYIARMLCLSTCMDFLDFLDFDGKDPILFLLGWWARLQAHNQLKKEDADVFIRDFLISQACEHVLFDTDYNGLQIISKLLSSLKRIRLFQSVRRFLYFFDLCTSTGFTMSIGTGAVMEEFLREWDDLWVHLMENAGGNRRSLANISRVAILRQLRQNRKPMYNCIMALEPYLTRVAMDQLLFRDFCDQAIPPISHY